MKETVSHVQLEEIWAISFATRDGAYRLRQVPGIETFCLPQRKELGVFNVVKAEGESALLLSPDMEPASLPEDIQEIVKNAGGTFIPYKLVLNYDNYSYKEVLRRVLPSWITIPTGYELVGHIAHFNFQEQHWPYRFVIGQTCLDKTRCVKTVVAKLGIVTNEFRTFDMEVIAGETNTLVSLREHGLKLKFDFEKAWFLKFLHGKTFRFFSSSTLGETVHVPRCIGIPDWHKSAVALQPFVSQMTCFWTSAVVQGHCR